MVMIHTHAHTRTYTHTHTNTHTQTHTHTHTHEWHETLKKKNSYSSKDEGMPTHPKTSLSIEDHVILSKCVFGHEARVRGVVHLVLDELQRVFRLG